MLRNSGSPSPSRGANMRSSAFLANLAQSGDTGSDEEDEETLQLKLAEIQAKLKLKKLQKNKELGSSPGLRDPTASPEARQRRNLAGPSLSPARGANHVEVPASPVRKVQQPAVDQSPTRVRLGIDKGLTAEDVSLKRAPSYKRLNGSPLAKRRADMLGKPLAEEPKPVSFNERLAGMRNDEIARKERQAKIQSMRSNAFGMGESDIDKYKKTAVDIPDEPIKAPTFSREQIMSKGKAAALPRSHTAPSLSGSQMDGGSSTNPEEQSASFESYSGLHLSRRILPHTALTRQVTGKTIFNVKDLLREVKSPDYSLPDIEEDIVVFAILAKKSEPRTHQQKGTKAKQEKEEEREKYMIMTLVDLDFEVDLFLFDTGFRRFWKLTEGTVIAILNPSIMPPPPGRADTGKFSLVINSGEDTILEIGVARDLGCCQSIKKDGQLCAAWVNKKRTQFCEFHSNEAVKKQRSGRVEMNTSSFGGHDGNKRGGFRGRGGRGGGSKFGHFGHSSQAESTKNSNYDWESRSQFFATRSMSAADLIDGKNMVDRKEQKEFLKRKLEAKEREKDMMKQLGNVGHGAGREYMHFSGAKTKDNPNPTSQLSQIRAARAAQGEESTQDLEITRGDRQIRLSPVKRKRPNSSSDAGSSIMRSSTTSTAYGWGNNLRTQLSKMKAGENFIRNEEPPVRKKTRFVTEKGIREAGRESLGNELGEKQPFTFDDDDDDELFIVK